MGKVDGLSRRSDWKVGVEKDNEIKYLLKTIGFVAYKK